MIDWSTCPVVERDPQRVSGAWVFRGTRVPIAALFENLEDGAQVSQFVQWFPGVSLEQVRAVLEHAARSALTPACLPSSATRNRGTPGASPPELSWTPLR